MHRLETLREEAIAASQGLSEGQRALVDALGDLQVERGHAADGYRAEELRGLERELRALLSIASSVAGAHELHEVLEVAAEEARLALDADSLSVARREGETGALRTLVRAGHPAPGPSTTVPIMFGGFAWGEMWATRRRDKPELGPRDLRFLQAIAGQLATAIGRAELFSRMAELALKDELTGAANRRAFDERLEASVAAALASGRELALVLCDVDHLKVLNDAGGHEAGDAALRRTSSVLRELVAPLPRALVARLGGDELAVLIEDAAPAAAKGLAEAALVRLADGPDPIGLSCGVATLGLGAESPADLLRAADAALYVAKRSGRGRVCVAASDPRAAWAEAAAERRGRRLLRDGAGSERVDVAALLADVVNLLDGPLATSGPAERLEVLLSACATAVDATAAALSLHEPGDPELLTLVSIDRRTGHTARHGDGAPEERYAVADFPGTERLLTRGGSAVWRADDEDAEPSERALLVEWAMDAVLLVSARDARGAWLLELFADGRTADLALVEPAARALALHCLYGGVPSDLSRSRAISAAARADTFA